MSVRTRETLIGFGKGKQTDIATANLVANIWRLNKLNASFVNPKLNTENDKDEYGKGHEYITKTYNTSWDVSGTLEKYASAEFAAWVMAFGLGKVVKSGTDPDFVYTCTPLDAANGDSAELPYFSFIEQIRPGAQAVLDRMTVGNVVESWNLTVGSGPGRANSKLTVELVGSGKIEDPSAIVLPSAVPEKLLPSASLTVSINGVDYVTSKNIVSLEATGKNNVRLEDGFFPGSGFQTAGDATTGAIRGRMEYGDREFGLQFRARFAYGSTELAKLKAQTVGTAVVSLAFDADNSLQLTYHQISFATADVEDADGRVTVNVVCDPQYHSANGILTAVAKCGIDGICQSAE